MQISCLGKLRAVWPGHHIHTQPACAVSGIQAPVDFTRMKGRNEVEMTGEGEKRDNQFELHTSVKSQTQRQLRESIVLRGTSVFRSGFYMKKKEQQKKLNFPLLNHTVRK